MGLFVKFLIVAMVIAVMLPFTVLKGKDGKPLMSLSDIKAPDLAIPKLPSAIKTPTSIKGTEGRDVVYKWKDKEGVTQFSSTPPPKGVEYTSKGYDPDLNLIQSVKVKTEQPEESADETKKQVKKPSDIGNPYSPKKIEKLFEDAKNVEKLLNDRMKQQEAMFGQKP